MLKTDLTGKIALVTGAAGGIGSGISRALAANGAVVYLADRDEERGLALEKELNDAGLKAFFAKGDVSSEDDCRRTIDRMVSESGGIDILVNNAGGNIELERRGKVHEYYYDAWLETIDKCMDGGYYMLHFAIPHMKQRGGRVIYTGSVTGYRMGLRNQCAYNVAKAAIHNMTRCSAIELAPYKITVNSVIPGTTWHKNFYDTLLKDPGMKPKFLSHVPLYEPNSPDDMAEAVLYFVSKEAERTTGVLMPVDGGWSAGYCRG